MGYITNSVKEYYYQDDLNIRPDHQPLFRKGARAPPPKAGLDV